MNAHEARAAELGFLKPDKYAAIERERRWLCDTPPEGLSAYHTDIEDLYVEGARLRLRAMRPSDRPAIFKLTRKADLAPDRRLITNIYLQEAEYDLLRGRLPGRPLSKRRRYLDCQGVALSVDLFSGRLQGLILAELEFDTDEAMAAFAAPPALGREVTQDLRYTGGALAADGAP